MSMLMQLGTRAMFAAYAQLQTTGQNIANASTAGYSRQQVILGTAPGQYTGSGYFGRGCHGADRHAGEQHVPHRAGRGHQGHRLG